MFFLLMIFNDAAAECTIDTTDTVVADPQARPRQVALTLLTSAFGACCPTLVYGKNCVPEAVALLATA